MKIAKQIAGAAWAVTALFAGVAHASTETFDITWSGAAFGNGASAIGQITLDTSVIQIGASGAIPIAAVQDLWITVKGTDRGAGDGTFTISDFNYVYFTSPTALDFSRELIGQSLGNGQVFGATDGGLGGDFNVHGKGSPLNEPSGTGYFQLMPDEYGGDGVDPLLVTSIAPAAAAVPEAGGAATLLAGLAMLMPLLRRRRDA